MFKKKSLIAAVKDSEWSVEQQELLSVLDCSAKALGDTEPIWLKERRIPDFQSKKCGTKGPKVLLLHGLFGAVSNWDDFLPYAESDLQLEALSFPLVTGHKSEVKVRDLALYAECFIRLNYDTPVVLCGNSLGGHVALLIAIHHPELVSKLILSGSSGLYEHVVEGMPIRPTRQFWHEQLQRVFYHSKFITEERIDEVEDVLRDKRTFLKLLATARSAKHENLQKELGGIDKETLLLWGANDQVTPLDVANNFHSLIKDSKLVVCEECGHAPMIEQPEWFAREVLTFLSA